MQVSGINRWGLKTMNNTEKRKCGFCKAVSDYFRKLFKLDTVEADAAEFQPDAIYLENQKPGIPLQTAWYLILLLLLLGIIWACVAEVDKVVVAEGKVITT